MKKQYWTNCVDWHLKTDTLIEMTENAREITKQTFLKRVEVDEDNKKLMRMFPNDYCYYKYKDIYFYEWSAIEFFYR